VNVASEHVLQKSCSCARQDKRSEMRGFTDASESYGDGPAAGGDGPARRASIDDRMLLNFERDPSIFE
jgi:hypothetical protein